MPTKCDCRSHAGRGKQLFLTRGAALNQSIKLARAHKSSEIYRCPRGAGFHLRSRPIVRETRRILAQYRGVHDVDTEDK